MRSRLAQLLVVFTLVSAIGGHWAVLQSIAWVGMTFRYAQNSSFKEALAKTFDGQHPCKLCKAVQAGKSAERQQALVKPEIKIDLWLAGTGTLLDPPPFPAVVPAAPSPFPLLDQAPLTPPPRLV